MVGVSGPPMKKGMSDMFQTPPEALDILIPYLNKGSFISEPACGKGNITNKLLKEGFDVLDRDILSGTDFLKMTKEDMCEIDYIITNPPYSLKDAFLKHCFELSIPFALLLPLSALESEKRQTLFRKYGIQLIIPNKRINFETPSGQGSGAWFCTAWFTWGLNLPKDITFVEVNWKNYKQRTSAVRGPDS